MIGTHSDSMIALSLFVAICVSYLLFDLTGRAATGNSWLRSAWVVGGGASLGLGLWTVCALGIQALGLPADATYHVPTALASYGVAALTAAVFLVLASRVPPAGPKLVAGSVAVTAGLSLMHVLELTAIRQPAVQRWHPGIAVLAALIALALSLALFRLAARFRHDLSDLVPARIAGAAALGLGFVVLCLAATGAVTIAATDQPFSAANTAHVSWLGVLGWVGLTLALLLFTGMIAFGDRRLDVRSRQLRASEERYRSFFLRSQAGVYQATLDGQLRDCNEAFARILGFASREECLARHITQYYGSPDERNRFVELLREQHRLTDFETKLRGKDGQVIWILETATLLDTREGEQQIVEGTILDITERKQAEAALIEVARRRAEEADRGQERVPGQHEPRDPHADERHHRHDRARARHRARRRSSATTSRPCSASADALLGDHQRHPRLLEDRGRQARARAGRTSTCATLLEDAVRTARAAGAREGPGAGTARSRRTCPTR